MQSFIKIDCNATAWAYSQPKSDYTVGQTDTHKGAIILLIGRML